MMTTPVKIRQAKTIKESSEVQHQKFIVAGVAPHTWIIDNEASLRLKAALKGDNMKYKLVPPHNHCADLGERPIRTFCQ